MSILKSTKGLVALVTGGASGLGRGAVDTLIKSGAKVAILDIPSSKGAEVAEKIGSDAIFCPADVREDKQVEAAFESVEKNFGRCDAIVNCAGISFAYKLYSVSKGTMTDGEKIKRTLDVNVYGTLNVTRYGLPLLCKNQADEMGQRGVIISTSSIAAFDGQVGQSVYAASKGAIASMTLPLARDYSDFGIRFMAIAPGLFDTPLLQSLPPKVHKFLSQLVPNPARMGDPLEYGSLVEHIIQNRYLNGEVIRLDGSLRMPP